MQVLTVFEGGQQAHSLLSFDSALERHGVVEIHGTEGSIVIPDPNRFAGRTAYVKPLTEIRDGEDFAQPWIELPEKGAVVGRGLGLLEMVRAIAEDRPHIASGELGTTRPRRHALGGRVGRERSVRDRRQLRRTCALAARGLRSVRPDPLSGIKPRGSRVDVEDDDLFCILGNQLRYGLVCRMR